MRACAPPSTAPASASKRHILNFEPIEIDEATPLELEFLMRLREEKRFDSPEALKTQIMRDVARAQRYFRRATP